MSKAVETQTDDVKKVDSAIGDAKKLALRCKTLEMQLRQSVPKKEHHEITSKLEKQIDSLEKELDRARDANQKTVAIKEQISGVEDLISSLIKTANANGKTLDSIEDDGSALAKALGAQGKVLDALAAKISQGTVTSQVYLQSLARIEKLEEEKRGMVRRFDYNSLEARCEELSRQLGTMVPSTDYASLKQKFDEATKQIADMVPASDYSALKGRVEELEGAMYTMVPRETLLSSQQRVSELEARLAEHVPQSVYDELVAKVMSLAEAVSGGEPQVEEAKEEPQAEVVAEPASVAEPVAEASVEQSVETSAPAASAPEASFTEAPAPQAEVQASVPDAPAAQPQIEVAITEAPAAPQQQAEVPAEPEATVAPSSSESVPEVREIQSQLAELGTQTQEARESVPIASSPQTEPSAFTFSGTNIVVRTGAEFAQVIGKMPAVILEVDIRSGGIEKWFAGSLSDGSTAESIRKVREGGAVGEDLRSQLASAVSSYAPAVQQAAPEVAPVIAAAAAAGAETTS